MSTSQHRPSSPVASPCPTARSGPNGRARAAQAGITVLELMVTVALIGIISAVGYNAIRFVTGETLREDSVKIAQTLRAAHNMATTSSTHHRVVFDLDNQRYRIEMCEGEILLRRSESEEVPEDDDKDGKGDDVSSGREAIERSLRDSSIPTELAEATSPEDAAKVAEALTGQRVGSARCRPPELPTGARDGRGNERKLMAEDGIKIRRIMVQHLEDEQSGGLVNVHFFPLGYTEKTLIEVSDEDGDTYTILIHAFSGRIEMRTGKVDGDEFMMRRADGEQVDERGER
ncbi:MAG: hypothetical protein AAGC55_12610 [Myxococcota bacterium]